MTINRRRAASSKISSEKKLGGHERERRYAGLIHGTVVKGLQKGDVLDKMGNLHSVKSGKKWQVFLYAYKRIEASQHLNILLPCLNAFPVDPKQYFMDREKCIAFKEEYIKDKGRDAARSLANDDVEAYLGSNTYVKSKDQLGKSTLAVCDSLKNKENLRSFLDEALFNSGEVAFLAIEDSTYKKDGLFKVFTRKDVLDILSARLFPAVSTAGRVPQDYNVAAQKTLLRYKKSAHGLPKNIVEIEIRNDSAKHYRQARFNMYSMDALCLFLDRPQSLPTRYLSRHVVAHGQAIETLHI